jgi:hypothetical protein
VLGTGYSLWCPPQLLGGEDNAGRPACLG